MSSSGPRKRLGQHFLADRHLLRRIVDVLEPTSRDVVLEIGAGEGSLTAELAPRVSHVVAIERDRGLIAGLGARGSGLGNVTVVEGDALRLDWHSLLFPNPVSRVPSPLPSPQPRAPSPAFKIIGNIPYNITSPLIEKALTPPLPRTDRLSRAGRGG